MTTLYLPGPPEEGLELCLPEDGDELERLYTLINGESRRQNWRPPKMRIVHEDEGKTLLPSDSPWLGSHALVFRRATANRFCDELAKYGEILPLLCDEAELIMFNPTKVVDALDEPASLVSRFSSGRIMRIKRYAFASPRLEGIEVFKIPNLRVSPTIFGSGLVSLWNELGLKGLRFELIWHG